MIDIDIWKYFQDIFQKRKELDCPECRTKVTIPIDLLPPNILANRILESMTQSQPQPPPPSLPCPKRNNSFNLISKPPAQHHQNLCPQVFHCHPSQYPQPIQLQLSFQCSHLRWLQSTLRFLSDQANLTFQEILQQIPSLI